MFERHDACSRLNKCLALSPAFWRMKGAPLLVVVRCSRLAREPRDVKTAEIPVEAQALLGHLGAFRKTRVDVGVYCASQVEMLVGMGRRLALGAGGGLCRLLLCGKVLRQRLRLLFGSHVRACRPKFGCNDDTYGAKDEAGDGPFGYGHTAVLVSSCQMKVT